MTTEKGKRPEVWLEPETGGWRDASCLEVQRGFQIALADTPLTWNIHDPNPFLERIHMPP